MHVFVAIAQPNTRIAGCVKTGLVKTMTGQIAFSRTLRALDADDSRASKLGLLTAIILLAAWTWWMLTPTVPQYEVSSSATLDLTNNSATAEFAATTRIHPGQHAQIDNGAIIEAEVVSVQNEPTGAIHVKLKLSSPTSHQPPTTHHQRATASIEVASVSPATIALHTLQ